MDWRILTAITVLSWGAYSVMLKKVSGQIPWHVSMFLFVSGYALLVGAYCLLHGKIPLGSLAQRTAIWPLLAGVVCGIGGITFFKAIPLAPGSVFLPLVSLSMIISGIGCLFFFKEPVTRELILGVVCAAMAVVLLAR